MALHLYNTLSQTKEPFKPADPANAKIYVCGPTVYDYSHVGHARCYVIYDVLIRHLRASGQKVTFVRNITDIDDKIIKRAAENGESPKELSERFTAAYQEDMRRLGNIDPDIEPKVSDHLTHICDMVSTLIEKGHAYEAEGDVYFSVDSFPSYGKLSHRKMDALKEGASDRLDSDQVSRKKNPADFALWKSNPDDATVSWDSPWGKGRPGWHIECSAMSIAHLGETLDLHGGGLDLVFPHHENEIAQSEAATGKLFSTCWMHNGFVQVNAKKMGKSLGNFFVARELFGLVEPEAMRYAMMTMHYRGPLNFEWVVEDEVYSFPLFEDAERRVEYIYKTQERLREIPANRIIQEDGNVVKEISQLDAEMTKALDDDLNMSIALSKIGEMLKAVNEVCDKAAQKKGKASANVIAAADAAFDAMGKRMGLGFQEYAEILGRIRDRRAKAKGIEPEMVEAMIVQRKEARDAKDFAKADEVRDEMLRLGVTLKDSPNGTTWTIA